MAGSRRVERKMRGLFFLDAGQSEDVSILSSFNGHLNVLFPGRFLEQLLGLATTWGIKFYKSSISKNPVATPSTPIPLLAVFLSLGNLSNTSPTHLVNKMSGQCYFFSFGEALREDKAESQQKP